MGAFLLALIVGVFSASPFGERDVAYAQTQDDNRLQSLSITGVSLSPAFNRDTTTYSARVPNATDKRPSQGDYQQQEGYGCH